MTTISDKKAETCLRDWIQYMAETNQLAYKTSLKTKSGVVFTVEIREVEGCKKYDV